MNSAPQYPETIPNPSRRGFWFFYSVATLLYVLTFVIYTWPLLWEFNASIPGISSGKGDAPSVLQNVYHVRRILNGVDLPLQTKYTFYPTGNGILMHGHTLLPAFIANLFPTVYSGINFIFLLSFLASALGAMWLAMKLGIEKYPAFAIGFIYAFCPYKLFQMQDHLWYVLTATVPLYVYQIIMLFREGLEKFFFNGTVIRRLTFAILLGIITSLSDYYTTFLLIIFTLIYAVAAWLGAAEINYFRKRTFWIYFLALTVTGGLITSFLDALGVDNKQANYWASDMLGYLIPMHKKSFHQFAEKIFNSNIALHAEPYFFMGFAFIYFVLLILWKSRNSSPNSVVNPSIRILSITAFIFFLLTIPLWKIGGLLIIPGPLAWFHYIPFVNNIRVSSRFFLIFSLLFPLVIFSIPFYISWIKKEILYLLLIVILFFEYKPDEYDFLRKAEIPDVMYRLSSLPGEVLLQVPSGIRDGFRESGKLNTNDLWYQGIHGKKITSGYHSRLPDRIFEDANQDTFFAPFYQLQECPDYSALDLTEEQAEAFIQNVKPDWLLVAPGWHQHSASIWIGNSLHAYLGDTIFQDEYLLISLQNAVQN